MTDGYHQIGDVRAGQFIQLATDGPWRRVHKLIHLSLVRAVDIRFRGGHRTVLPVETTVRVRVWTEVGMELVS